MTSLLRFPKPSFYVNSHFGARMPHLSESPTRPWSLPVVTASLVPLMGSLIKKRRKRMRKKKHKKMLKRTRFQRRAKK
jgi:hypothetical protein